MYFRPRVKRQLCEVALLGNLAGGSDQRKLRPALVEQSGGSKLERKTGNGGQKRNKKGLYTRAETLSK